VLIEECLIGQEVSFFALCDGKTAIPLGAAQDHKRVGDGDTGPNTGGMGAYSPPPVFTDALRDDVMTRIVNPVLAEMARRGTPFRGVLFVGLMITADGPRLIEFNVRFGDPETQPLLARLKTPLGGLLYAAATGTLAEQPPLQWSDGAAVAVVLAAENYPASPVTGGVIDGLDVAGADGTMIVHAGTALDAHGRVVSAGGRVLAVVGTGAELATARHAAYATIANLDLAGSFYRSDIAQQAADDAAQEKTAQEETVR